MSERTPALRLDVVAGLTAASVVLPKAMAYATVAGLPVAVGLYTAFVPMAIYALLGSSRVLSASSTTTLAILAGAAALTGGARRRSRPPPHRDRDAHGARGRRCCCWRAVLRLGFVADFISAPVLTGFKAGIGLVIVLDQIPKLLGVHVEKHGFFQDPLALARHVPETSILTLAVARRDFRGADRPRPLAAPFTGTAGRRRREHRRVVVLRPLRPRRLDGGERAARTSRLSTLPDPGWCGSCFPARSASR